MLHPPFIPCTQAAQLPATGPYLDAGGVPEGEVVGGEVLQAQQGVTHDGGHLRLTAHVAPQAVRKHLPAVHSCRQTRHSGRHADRRVGGEGEGWSERAEGMLGRWPPPSTQPSSRRQQDTLLIAPA